MQLACVFVNRLLNNLRNAQRKITVGSNMKQDLTWFIQFLTRMNGVVMFDEGRPKIEVYVDASLSVIGAFWGDQIYAVSRHIWATQGLSITQLELLNVLIALRLVRFGENSASNSL